MSSKNQKKISYSYHRKLKRGKEDLVKNNLPPVAPHPDGNRLKRRKKAAIDRSRKPKPYFLSDKHCAEKDRIFDHVEFMTKRHHARKVNELAEVLLLTGKISKKIKRNRNVSPAMMIEISERVVKLRKEYARS